MTLSSQEALLGAKRLAIRSVGQRCDAFFGLKFARGGLIRGEIGTGVSDIALLAALETAQDLSIPLFVIDKIGAHGDIRSWLPFHGMTLVNPEALESYRPLDEDFILAISDRCYKVATSYRNRIREFERAALHRFFYSYDSGFNIALRPHEVILSISGSRHSL